MNVIWKFENSQLVAHNEIGVLLCAWVADEEMGWPLANLLNHAQSLSQLLLSFWPMPELAQVAPS